MLEYLFSLSLLILAVIVIRAICKKRVSGKLVYALWLAVIIRLIVPINLISIDMPFPEISELVAAVPENNEVTAPTITVPSTENKEQASLESTVEKPIRLPENNVTAQFEPAPLDNKISESTVKIDLEKVLLCVWLLGSGITLFAFAVPFAITEVRLRKSRRYHSTVASTKVFVSDKVATPCVTGIIPKIYITPAAEECCDLSLIILHEKTHIRHGDHIWAIIRIALIIAFWWNPLIWAAALLSKRDAEVACDESVVRSMSSEERISYGRLIVDMIPKRGGFAVAFANKPIKYRLLRLTGKFKTTILAAIISVFTIVLCCLFAFVSNGVDDGENTLIHIHRFNEKATCTTSSRCACGDIKGKPLGHKWKDADCTNPKTCTRCSLTDGIPLPHSWLEATCDRAKTCAECKIEMGEHLEHTWVPATCTGDEYCSHCRETREKALGHDFTEATCTTAKICNRCSYTEGDPLGHSYYLGVCTRCNTVDSAFYADIKSKFYSPYDGYSKKSAKNTITGLGYSSDEAEIILTNLNINWYEQALIAARYYTTNRDFYSEQDFRSNMTYLGFTADEINYAVKIAMEENPPAIIKLNYSNVHDLTTERPTDKSEKKKEESEAVSEDDGLGKYGFPLFDWDYSMRP